MHNTKKKIKVEFLVLGSLVVLLTMYLVFRNPNRLSYSIPELKKIEKTVFSHIEIESSGQIVKLSRNADLWEILPKNYSAAPEKIAKVLDVIADMKITTLVSKTGEHERYGLNPRQRIRVRAFTADPDTPVRDFFIGKAAATYGHTYIQFPKQKNVYHASGSFRNSFEGKINDWRNKKLFDFDPKSINRISVQISGKTRTFIRNPAPVSVTGKGKKTSAGESEQTVTWKSSDSGEVKDSDIQSLIRRISDLRCQEFTENENPDSTESQVLKIELRGRETFSLHMARKSGSKEELYSGKASHIKGAFTLSAYNAKEITDKSKSLLGISDNPVKK